MAESTDLQGRVAVVTGASSGIGRAVAERLGGQGATVHLLGRTAEPMEASVAAIHAAGGDAHSVVLDVCDADALAGAIDRAADGAGRLDLLVNNAGLGINRPILDGHLDQWRQMFEVNVLALLVGCQAAVAAMRRHGSGGHIVNISSTGALRPDSGVYGSTKAAVNYLTEALRQELEGDDIRVTSLMPGAVATNFVRNFDPEVVNSIGAVIGMEIDFQPGERLPDEVLEKAQAALSSHIATPDDIAEAVSFVVSQPLRLNIPSVVVRPAQTLNF